ncbi:unnamed protein product [Cunninghamella echinulata]
MCAEEVELLYKENKRVVDNSNNNILSVPIIQYVLQSDSTIHVNKFPHDYDPVESIYYGTAYLMQQQKFSLWKEDQLGSHIWNFFYLSPGQRMPITYQSKHHIYLEDTF